MGRLWHPLSTSSTPLTSTSAAGASVSKFCKAGHGVGSVEANVFPAASGDAAGSGGESSRNDSQRLSSGLSLLERRTA